ncbi:MAG: chitobiase/beta-hexosaminidase C-terminal domain-containing protein, partial [Christensenellaceae bacterium]
TIKIYTPQTVDLNDYVRSGTERFGAPVEMGDTIQELTLTQDKSFSITIDKGNNADQMNIKGAAKMLNMQIKEKVVPLMDKYALGKWAQLAGKVVGSAEPTRENITQKIYDGATALDNELVPGDNRLIYLPSSQYNNLRLSKEFLAVDNLAEKALTKGYVGMVADMRVIKIPDSYLPANVRFLITYKQSVINPNKIKTMRVLDQQRGIDGSVLEGRNYFDAFVLGARAMGVYTLADTSAVLAAPAVTISAHSAAITAVAGVTFKYTIDGSDPRYSASAKVYSAAVTTKAGEEFKAYGEKENCFPSAVTTAKDA